MKFEWDEARESFRKKKPIKMFRWSTSTGLWCWILIDHDVNHWLWYLIDKHENS